MTREGLSVLGLKYWDPSIAQLINNGQRYYVHYNHGDLSRVYLSYQGDYIEVPLVDRSVGPFTFYELREARRSLKGASRSQDNSRVLFSAIEHQRRIEDEAASKSKKARQKQARRAETNESIPTIERVDYSHPIEEIDFEEANRI